MKTVDQELIEYVSKRYDDNNNNARQFTGLDLMYAIKYGVGLAQKWYLMSEKPEGKCEVLMKREVDGNKDGPYVKGWYDPDDGFWSVSGSCDFTHWRLIELK